jgi:hypothetical protein
MEFGALRAKSTECGLEEGFGERREVEWWNDVFWERRLGFSSQFSTDFALKSTEFIPVRTRNEAKNVEYSAFWVILS